MKTLRVNEIFYSLQGEGARAGQASIFIRLSGCDLACGFCDTEFESGKDFSLEELAAAIAPYKCNWIIWTGGEPMLQLGNPRGLEFLREFRQLFPSYSHAIESNGNHAIPRAYFDWIVVSPKVAEHVLEKHFTPPQGWLGGTLIDELRYVRHAGQPGIPTPRVAAKRKFLSPRFNGDKPDPASIDHCFNLCLEHPEWALSLQTHKLIKVL